MGEPLESVYSTDVHGRISFGIDLVAGVFGGVLAGHPLDTIKVRLQSQSQSKKYNGIWSCFRSIIKEEKVTGLYKGLTSPLVGVALINSLLFGAYGSALRFVAEDPNAPTVSNIFWAGSISGFINAFFSCPMELVKIRLQNQTGDRKKAIYRGSLDCIQKIYRAEGSRGLFRGLSVTLIRETPSYGAYFASYEIMTRLLLPEDADPSEPSPRLLFAGGVAGVIGWLSTYPFDVVKTRLQSEGGVQKYGGMINCFRAVAKQEGYRVFFTGMGATALRAFPTNAATFYVVVSVQNILYWWYAKRQQDLVSC